jgi:hypothetical protein
VSSYWNPWVSMIGIISLGYKCQAKITLIMIHTLNCN